MSCWLVGRQPRRIALVRTTDLPVDLHAPDIKIALSVLPFIVLWFDLFVIPV